LMPESGHIQYEILIRIAGTNYGHPHQIALKCDENMSRAEIDPKIRLSSCYEKVYDLKGLLLRPHVGPASKVLLDNIGKIV